MLACPAESTSQPAKEECARLHSSKGFEHTALSICGNVTRKTISVGVGDRVTARVCMCGAPSIIKSSENSRLFLTCFFGVCKYFRWADTVLDPPFYHLAHSRVVWKLLCRPTFKALPPNLSQVTECIIQGSLGDCWFLSAVAVLSENPAMLAKVFSPQMNAAENEVYEFRFCIAGVWESHRVDGHVPVYSTGRNEGVEAFCRTWKNVMFGPLIEKAYAKAYGCYAALHGGLIAEALFDLTGCPTESFPLRSNMDLDLLWARLNSFKDNSFLMGCSTSHEGEEGLVTQHAYSILDLVELHDISVGRQRKMTEFFAKAEIPVEARVSVRLVQIRNPWGRKEWTGDWSGRSDKWTRRLTGQIPGFRERDQKGKFWIELSDFAKWFCDLDLAKTHPDWWTWARSVPQASVVPLARLLSSSGECVKFQISTQAAAWTYLSVIQPSVRGNPGKYYADVNLLLSCGGRIVGACVGQSGRVITLETLLNPFFEYELIAFSATSQFPWEDIVVRIFSSQQLLVRQLTGPGCSSAAFEKAVAECLPVMRVVDLTDSVSLQIHGGRNWVAFLLVGRKSGAVPIQVSLHVNLTDSALRSIGRWQAVADEGTTLLGLIVRARTSTKNSGMEGYTFEVDLSATEKRPCHTNRANVIELD